MVDYVQNPVFEFVLISPIVANFNGARLLVKIIMGECCLHFVCFIEGLMLHKYWLRYI
jgi:hypothetical protein